MAAPQPQLCVLPAVTRNHGEAAAPASGQSAAPPSIPAVWGIDTCPLCGYAQADVDPDGVLWCPACGYSKKGCYT